jgi:hypothetical protein
MPEQPIQPPSRTRADFSVPAILELRRKMMAKLARFYTGSVLVARDFDLLVDEIFASLPDGIPRQHVHESLSHLAGTEMTQDLLRTNLWRLAGNLKKLRKQPVPPWIVQSGLEWAPVQITAANKQRNRFNKLGYTFTFQILAGLACPLAITRFWTVDFCWFVSNELGYARRRFSENRLPKNIFQDPRELVTLRLSVQLDPKFSTATEPGFEKVKVTSVQKSWNREQMAFRDRMDDAHACPKGYPDSRQCHLCHVGYRECRAGCHAATYTTRPCLGCIRDDALFDPDKPADFCIECVARKQIERK